MWDRPHVQHFKSNRDHRSFYCNARQCPDEEHLYWSSRRNCNQKKTSLRHKVRLQAQTNTMEDTCSVLFLWETIPDSSKYFICGESTCTATPGSKTRYKGDVGHIYPTLTTCLPAKAFFFILKCTSSFNPSLSFISTNILRQHSSTITSLKVSK